MSDIADAFAPPWTEEVRRAENETIVYTLPRMDMDDWAACCQTLKANRRKEAEAKLLADVRLQPADRHWLLMRQDDEPVTFMYAFHYRTETPAGIKSTIKKALMKSGAVVHRNGTGDERVEIKTDADAERWAKLIPPVRQRELARIIADPPLTVAKPKDAADPNASPAASPTGESSPPSSEDSSPASSPEA